MKIFNNITSYGEPSSESAIDVLNKKPFLNRWFGFLGVFVLYLATFSLAYLPALTANYAYHDDFLFLFKRKDGFHVEHEMFWAIGRIAGDWILQMSQCLIHHIDDFKIMRFLSVVLLSVCATLLFRWVKSFHLNRIDSFLFVGIIFTATPFQSLVPWACTMYVFAALMYSILAAISAGKSLELEGWKRFKYVIMSLGFFVMSLLTYQTAAMFYWVVWGGKFLFEKPGDFNTLWKRIWGVSQIAFLSMLTYLVILKVFCQPYVNYLEGLYNPYDWSSNYWAKLIWFFREPVYNALNIWAIFPDIKIMWLTLLIFIIGGCVTWVQLRRNKMVSKEVYYLGACLFIVVFSAFILAYLPNILNQRPSPFYRTFLGLTTMIIFIWLWSGQALLSLIPRQLRDISLTVILFISLNLGVYQCYKNVWLYRVLPSQLEWEYTVNQMAAADFSFYDHMIVVMPFAGRTDRYDEFGIFTTFFHQDIKGFMLAALNLAGKSDDYWQRFRNLTYVSSEQEIPQNGRFLIVDMRQPKSLYEQIIIRSKE